MRAPRPAEGPRWDGRKDALADAFEGPLVGALVEIRAPVPPRDDVTVLLFGEAAAAADWGDALKPVADAAYGVAFQANILRVDLTKRVGAFAAKPALTLKLADGQGLVRAP